MRKKIAAIVAAVVGLLVIAPAAQADYFISKRRAESFARSQFYKRYEPAGSIRTRCRPQGRSAPQPGYVYHRWTCVWVDLGDDTWGAFLIAGNSRGPDWYHVKLLKGVTPL